MLSNFVRVITQEQDNLGINMLWKASLLFTSILIITLLFYISVSSGRMGSYCTVLPNGIYSAFSPKQPPALGKSW